MYYDRNTFYELKFCYRNTQEGVAIIITLADSMLQRNRYTLIQTKRNLMCSEVVIHKLFEYNKIWVFKVFKIRII